MHKSLADRSSRQLLDKLMLVDLLLIDELGYLNLRPEQCDIFFKLMEERYAKKATIITTNLEYDDWYGFLAQKEMVGAPLDRLRHRCHTSILYIDAQELNGSAYALNAREYDMWAENLTAAQRLR